MNSLIYALIVGFVQSIFVLFLYLICAFLKFFTNSTKILKIIIFIGIFHFFLLLFGAMANSIWMISIYNNLYISQDTVVDFWPFIPFGQWVLNQFFADPNIKGELLNGATLLQMKIIWSVFSSIVWILTIFSSIKTISYISKRKNKNIENQLFASLLCYSFLPILFFIPFIINNFISSPYSLISIDFWEDLSSIFILYVPIGTLSVLVSSTLFFYKNRSKHIISLNNA